MKTRSNTLQPSTSKRRAKRLPQKDKIIRTLERDGWAYEIYQRPSGAYLLCGVEIDGDDWRTEEHTTIRACLAQATPIETDEALLDMAEAE